MLIFNIGTFTIKNVKSTAEGESAKVKVKVRVNLNGILTIASATLIEKREPTQQEKEEEEAQQQQQQQQQNNMDVDSQPADKKDKPDQEAQANEPPAPEVCNFTVHTLRRRSCVGIDATSTRESFSFCLIILPRRTRNTQILC